MSKAAEQKALEAYPVKIRHAMDSNRNYRDGYVKGYDKAFQDFLEKAEGYLKNTLSDRVEIEVFGALIPSIVSKKEFIDNFKNYMSTEYHGQNTEES